MAAPPAEDGDGGPEPFRRGWGPLLPLRMALLVALHASVARAQDGLGPGSAEAASGAVTPAADESGLFGPLLDDPTLGGKLHIAYRAAYEAKFYRFHSYRFNFPSEVSPLDAAAAAELEERHQNRDHDQDLDQHLILRTKDLFLPEGESLRGILDGVDTEVSLRWRYDLDGTPTGDESFDGWDTGGSQDFHLRTINARLKLLRKHLEVAGGRIFVEGAEWAHLDGVEVTGRGLAFLGRPFEVTGFAGSRVSFYDTVPRSTVLGGELRIQPWPEGRLELASFYFYEHTFRAELEQRLGEDLRAEVVYRQIDEDPETVRVRLDGDWSEKGWSLRLEYFGKFGLDAKDFFYDFTSVVGNQGREEEFFRYFNLGDLDPFDEGTVEVRWSPARRVGLFTGGTVHLLRGESEEDQFNTDWYEVWGGVDTSHLPWDGFTSRATVRYVHTDHARRRFADRDPFLVEDVRADGEPSFLGLELLVEQDLARRAAVGATLVLRRYEYDSRFVHLEDLLGLGATAYGRWRQNRFLTYTLSYAYESDFELINPDLEDVHGVRGEVLFSF